MNSKVAIVTGITGQDGAYLTQVFQINAIPFMAHTAALAMSTSGGLNSWVYMRIKIYIWLNMI